MIVVTDLAETITNLSNRISTKKAELRGSAFLIGAKYFLKKILIFSDEFC